MNRRCRENRDTLYRRVMYLEQQHVNGNRKSFVVGERIALRWALQIIEEADAAGLIPQLEASRTFGVAEWLRRQEEIEQHERERYARKANRLALLQELNESEDLPHDDALRNRVPGSFEGGKRR